MSKFSVGDYAMTLKSLGRFLPAGSVVELYKPYYPGEKIGSEKNPMVVLERGWWCAHAEKGDRLPFAERYLMPLHGEFAPLEREKSSEVPA